MYGEDNRKTKIKRFYYTGCLLLYVIFINITNVSSWCGKGPWNITSTVWSYIVSMIIFTIISFGLENLVISGFVFKEFGLFGAKFVREESEKNLLEQKEYISILEYSIKSMYDVSCNMVELFQDVNITEKIRDKAFDITDELQKILDCYYSHKFENVIINVEKYNQTANTIADIVDGLFLQYNLETKEKIQFEIDLLTHNRTANYFKNKSNSLYVITEPIDFVDKNTMIMITVYSKKDIIASDLHAIACLFNILKIQYGKI